ncbi:hypothetical protein SAMN05444285_1054 [Draconibacterium orientale]|uniref:Uncharacterized protein n=1 Tax=Draconibacterium orientale TaxID=1168034 RepID=X5E631_9BACT|nr:hypothetical protein FH5T_15420 [Draconibacterium orientale]SET02773.1 hypothetical protein SAMN05444285_1054 [Draconibacterium orientale]
MKNKARLILLLSILGITFYCLFVQPELLGVRISKSLNFPLGSLISWLGIVAYTLLLHLFIKLPTKSILLKVDKVLRYFHIGMALFWLPMSYFISGNLAFAFQNKPIAFIIWIGYTLVILFFPLILLVLKLFNRAEK